MSKISMKFIRKSLSTVLLIGFIVLTATLNTYAHSGRTDSSGGHKDNRNASGLGGYHYHHGMGPHLHPNGVCPYAAPKVLPTPPVVSVSNVKINDGVGTLLIGEKGPVPDTNLSTYCLVCENLGSTVYEIKGSGMISL